MFNQVFPYLIEQFSRIINFVFNLPINENPNISLGQFILGLAFIGLIIYFIFGNNFFPSLSDFNKTSTKKDIPKGKE